MDCLNLNGVRRKAVWHVHQGEETSEIGNKSFIVSKNQNARVAFFVRFPSEAKKDHGLAGAPPAMEYQLSRAESIEPFFVDSGSTNSIHANAIQMCGLDCFGEEVTAALE